MTTTTTNTLQDQIRDILRSETYLKENADGTFFDELYADYRDTLDKAIAIELFNSSSPFEKFYDALTEWYMEAEFEAFDEAASKVMKNLKGADEDEVIEIMRDIVYFDYPADHYLKQKFCTNILIDTGDGNYDFVLNSVFPHYDGEYDTEIEDEASLTWLAGTQGYTKAQLWEALQQGDMADAHNFLESVRVEVANASSHMNALVFLVELTLEQLIDLKQHVDNAVDGEYLVVDKRVMTGLYDPWCGGGSVLEIQLEKDVKIPFKFIRSMIPDGGDGYGIANVYGMCESAWRYGGVKEIITKEG